MQWMAAFATSPWLSSWSLVASLVAGLFLLVFDGWLSIANSGHHDFHLGHWLIVACCLIVVSAHYGAAG